MKTLFSIISKVLDSPYIKASFFLARLSGQLML